MPFNSAEFLFLFLPLVLLGTFVLARSSWQGSAAAWLAIVSLAFYGWEKPGRLLPVIAVSIVFNLLVGRRVARTQRKAWLWFGVGGNLAWLSGFKYLGFVTTSLAGLGLPIPITHIALPIGISFYTFTQIAVLVDASRGAAVLYRPIEYTLFVTFFPHLIAGPILHHRDTMPQLVRPGAFRFQAGTIAAGLSWFAVGMFKKVQLADNVAPFANAMFDAAARADHLSGPVAWVGALAYALQIYFDFSGYSDMALGLALMVGVTFPLNFLSPYKATSLIDFWRRWHMTLSRFLRDYLYVPLGGNRHGPARQRLNLLLTMMLGGLWHGAGWTFILWGALHGTCLVLNHAWRAVAAGRRWCLPPMVGQGLTLLIVVLAWVPFRADSLSATTRIWSAMLLPGADTEPPKGIAWVVSLAAIALLAPNSAELFGRPETLRAALWQTSLATALLLGLCLGLAMSGSLRAPTAFLYFRF